MSQASGIGWSACGCDVLGDFLYITKDGSKVTGIIPMRIYVLLIRSPDMACNFGG